MEVSFIYPSTHHRTGGVVVLYHFAGALARRGHKVHFIHGPAWKDRIRTVEELAWFPFEPSIEHHVVDSLDDGALPSADVVFSPWQSVGDLPSVTGPEHMGLPAIFVQGFRMLPFEIERATYRIRGPKACVARWLTDVGAKLGVPREQLWYVPLGIDHEVFSVRTPLDEREFDAAVLFNNHPHKGSTLAFEALELLSERIPGFRAVMFGAIRPWRQLPDWLTFRYALDHPGLADEVYNATRVFIQASYYEGFGLTPVEAMACGAALVTTDNGGSRDYAVDGETALVTPVGDAEAIADAAEALLRDDERRARLATAGERYVRRFTWERGGEVLEANLERYLADPEAFRKPASGDGEDVGLSW